MRQSQKDKEEIRYLDIKNEQLQIEETQRRISLEKELMLFCKEQEESIKELFQKEIYELVKNQEVLQDRIQSLEQEKSSLMKINKRLIKNEQRLLDHQKKSLKLEQLHQFEERELSRMKVNSERHQQKRPFSEFHYRKSNYENYLPQSLMSGNNNSSTCASNNVQDQGPKSRQASFDYNLALSNQKPSVQSRYNTEENEAPAQPLGSNSSNVKTPNSSNNNRSQQRNENAHHTRATEILDKLCEIFRITDHNKVLSCVKKTERVLRSVPKLESMIQEICAIVLPDGQIDSLIPTLRSWQDQIQLTTTISRHYDEICRLFNIKKNENIIQKVEIIRIQLDDYLKFLKIARSILSMEVSPGQEVLNTVIQLLQSCSADN